MTAENAIANWLTYLEIAVVKLEPLRCPRLPPWCTRSIFLANKRIN
jgi:hypothetical protein